MHTLTYLIVRSILFIFSVLPLPISSAIGGKLAQLLGPRTRRHKVVLKNLALIFPDKPAQWHKETASKMWNHIGRVFAEFPALKSGKLLRQIHHIKNEQLLNGCPQVIFASAHFGQWELCIPVAKDHGLGPITSLYRHINNQKIDKLLKEHRAPAHDIMERKKGDNALALVKALKRGHYLGILIDQRLTKGDVYPYLGVESPTNTVAMKLSVKTGVPIMIAFVTRDSGVKFTGHVYELIYPPEEGTDDEKVEVMTKQVFDIFEQIIREYPEQYFWTHDRWKG